MFSNFINFYGRRVGHLSANLKDLITNLLPQYELNPDSISKEDFLSYAMQFKQINLEIGFGSGDFIFQQASQNPDQLYIGVEVFLNGVGQLLSKLDGHFLNNLKIYNNNIYLILNSLPVQFFDNIYILFPDPWHKLRHNKRRLINNTNLLIFHHILKNNGKLYFVTDHENYAKWGYDHLREHKNFILNHNHIEAFKECPIPNFSTKYQRKALLEHRDIYHFVATKKA